MQKRWAALFDWDGVMVDSSRAHRISWERLAVEEGHLLPEGHFERGFGMKNAQIIPGLLGWTQDPVEVKRISDRKEALYREIIREEGIEALPGAHTWLETLKSAGIPCVIGSSTDRVNIEMILGILGLENYFLGMVTSENVRLGKPDPDVFLQAAALTGVEPGSCVVFEDAPVGIQAGKAGGMKVVAVATSHPAGSLQEADLVLEGLQDATLEKIGGLWKRTL